MNTRSTASQGLNRRQLLGTAAAAGLAASSGGFGVAAAWNGALAPVASVHLDVPFIDAHGSAAPYRQPIRLPADAGAFDPHELA